MAIRCSAMWGWMFPVHLLFLVGMVLISRVYIKTLKRYIWIHKAHYDNLDRPLQHRWLVFVFIKVHLTITYRATERRWYHLSTHVQHSQVGLPDGLVLCNTCTAGLYLISIPRNTLPLKYWQPAVRVPPPPPHCPPSSVGVGHYKLNLTFLPLPGGSRISLKGGGKGNQFMIVCITKVFYWM